MCEHRAFCHSSQKTPMLDINELAHQTAWAYRLLLGNRSSGVRWRKSHVITMNSFFLKKRE
jgi:hypothetical protein